MAACFRGGQASDTVAATIRESMAPITRYRSGLD
jgi:hypothetical protein